MLFDHFADLNWLAVLVAGIAYLVLGSIWYANALFGRQYRAATGAGDAMPVTKSLVYNVIGWLISAVAMGLLSFAIGADSAGDGAVLGLVVGVGIVASHQFVGEQFAYGKSTVSMINTPYTVLGFIVMGVILAVWR